MSAIWGIVDLNNNKPAEGDFSRMEKVYRSKKIDRIDTFFQLHFYMGCGLQYAVKEAREEHFPYGDGENRYFVADAILDNRKEIKEYFGIAADTDGAIMYHALQRDWDGALDNMLGAYAFAYYDKEKSELSLVNDVVGNRSVYYLYENGRVYFSTLLEAITNVKKGLQVNKTWFKNYFGLNDLRVVSEARETPYQGIYRVEPGEVVKFTANGMERRAYWDPFKNRKTIKLSSDEEYKELVCSVFKECVESLIRDGSETAILLSGGLDSNAVAAYAAPKLKEIGRKLYSFTSVPNKEKSRIPKNQYYVEDETEYIEELQTCHSNLEPEYVDASEGNLLAQNREIQRVLEIPFKTVLNMPWIYRAYKMAAEKGCGIMLSGQYGNVTISYGDFHCLFVTLLQKGRVLRMIKEINAYSRRYKTSRKLILKNVLQAPKEDNFKVFSRYMYDKNALRQVGETEVKYSLETGIIPRDPTRDKRLIELVLSLPLEIFVSDGRERRLVREYMKDIIPEKIVSDVFHRGRQGIGCRKNMYEQWDEITLELEKSFAWEGAGEYVDTEAVKAKMENRGELFAPDNGFEMVKLMYSGLTLEYLERMNETEILL